MSRKGRIALLISLLLIVVVTPPVVLGDWTSYLKDVQNTGNSTADAPRENATVLWERSSDGAVPSSPTVVNGSLFIGALGDEYFETFSSYQDRGMSYSSDDVGSLYSIDVETGEVAWSISSEGGVWSSPAYYDGSIFFGTLGGKMYRVDAESGETEWSFGTQYPVFSSPLVNEGRVYFGTRHPQSHEHFPQHEFSLYSLDTSDGTQVWSVDFEEGVFGGPAYYEGNLYVGTLEGVMYSIEADSGNIVWEHETRGPEEEDVLRFLEDDPFYMNGSVQSAPSVEDGSVYFGTYAGEVYSLNASTGNTNWVFSTRGPISSTPAVSEDEIYVGSYDGSLYSIDRESGDELWSVSTDGRISKSSPAVTDSTVIVGSTDGNLYTVDKETQETLWSYPTEEWILSSPAVTEQGVFFNSIQGMFAVEESGSGEKVSEITQDESREEPRIREHRTSNRNSDERGSETVYRAIGIILLGLLASVILYLLARRD